MPGRVSGILPQRSPGALGMQYVFGLEFVELKDAAHGFHGNAIFSRWPILWAEVLRLPEQYNWYYDRQKRIGGRNAVFAKLDVQGQEVGAVSIHLENRTSGAGRLQQMKAVLQEAERVFPGIPVVLGGDLNTNTFDGRDKAVIRHLCDEPEELAGGDRKSTGMNRFCRTALQQAMHGGRLRAARTAHGANRCRKAAACI